MADQDARDELTDELGEPPPESVLALPAESRRLLARQLRDAREREHEQAERAVTRALRGVPLPVRGLVRKALIG